MHYSHWILFTVGWLLHVLLQAKASVNSKSNSLENVRQWLKLSWLVLIVRAFAAVLLMLLWHEAPQLFGQIAGAAIPMTKATCGIAGLAVDAFIDKLGAIFGLKIEIPVVAPPEQKPEPKP